MPFVSLAQKKYLYANRPAVAERFASETPSGKKLPERIHPKTDGKRGRAPHARVKY